MLIKLMCTSFVVILQEKGKYLGNSGVHFIQEMIAKEIPKVSKRKRAIKISPRQNWMTVAEIGKEVVWKKTENLGRR